ncbi:MAG TPA: hypothetical protein EYN91_19205 [Candidatus Melainabacteria bacterium]|nr:hypothetical protein [Candidatus Melainabacteria bacterium]
MDTNSLETIDNTKSKVARRDVVEKFDLWFEELTQSGIWPLSVVSSLGLTTLFAGLPCLAVFGLLSSIYAIGAGLTSGLVSSATWLVLARCGWPKSLRVILSFWSPVCVALVLMRPVFGLLDKNSILSPVILLMIVLPLIVGMISWMFPYFYSECLRNGKLTSAQSIDLVEEKEARSDSLQIDNDLPEFKK